MIGPRQPEFYPYTFARKKIDSKKAMQNECRHLKKATGTWISLPFCPQLHVGFQACLYPSQAQKVFITDTDANFFTGSSSESCSMFIEKGFTIPLIVCTVPSICTEQKLRLFTDKPIAKNEQSHLMFIYKSLNILLLSFNKTRALLRPLPDINLGSRSKALSQPTNRLILCSDE